MSKHKQPDPRFYRFYTPEGTQIALDLDLVDQMWEGQKPGTIVLVVLGHPAVVVCGNYDEFMDGGVDHYDYRVANPPPRQGAEIIPLKPVSGPE